MAVDPLNSIVPFNRKRGRKWFCTFAIGYGKNTNEVKPTLVNDGCHRRGINNVNSSTYEWKT